MSDARECSAPDCSEPARSVQTTCSTRCENVAVKVAAERMSQDDITEPVPEERVAEIRERVNESFDRMNEKIERAAGESDE